MLSTHFIKFLLKSPSSLIIVLAMITNYYENMAIKAQSHVNANKTCDGVIGEPIHLFTVTVRSQTLNILYTVTHYTLRGKTT